MFGRNKKPRGKLVRTHENLIEKDIKRIIDKRAYIHDNYYWILIMGDDKPSDNDKVIGSLPIDSVCCMNRKYEKELRELAMFLKCIHFYTEYWE